jgi:hypothetical protein
MEKIKDFLKLYRSGITLLLLCLCVAVITAAVCNAFGASDAKVVASSIVGGTLSVLIVGTLFRIEHMVQPMINDWGVFGMVLGTIITMLLF